MSGAVKKTGAVTKVNKSMPPEAQTLLQNILAMFQELQNLLSAGTDNGADAGGADTGSGSNELDTVINALKALASGDQNTDNQDGDGADDKDKAQKDLVNGQADGSTASDGAQERLAGDAQETDQKNISEVAKTLIGMFASLAQVQKSGGAAPVGKPAVQPVQSGNSEIAVLKQQVGVMAQVMSEIIEGLTIAKSGAVPALPSPKERPIATIDTNAILKALAGAAGNVGPTDTDPAASATKSMHDFANLFARAAIK